MNFCSKQECTNSVPLIFVQSKIFQSRMRQNGMKFSQDWNIEFKKSFELYRQISFKVRTKVGFNFIHFALTKVNEMRSFTQKTLFYQPHKFMKYLMKFYWQLSQIFQSFPVSYFTVFKKIQQNSTIFNNIQQNFTVKHYAFIQFHSILSLLVFAFNVFKSLGQNFSLIQTLLNYRNFGLSDGKM